jgi:O-6-methylguanine DNA methyltransferase
MKKYSSFKTPVGTVYVAATERGVCAVALRRTEAEFAEKHKGAIRDDAALAGIVAPLRRCMAGENVSLESINVDMSDATEFQRAAWNELRAVPRGSVVSYRELAARIGRPRAARAVGNAMRRNPALLVIPCHRVVRSDGSLGGFACGTDIKRYLLSLESARGRELSRKVSPTSPPKSSGLHPTAARS